MTKCDEEGCEREVENTGVHGADSSNLNCASLGCASRQLCLALFASARQCLVHPRRRAIELQSVYNDAEFGMGNMALHRPKIARPSTPRAHVPRNVRASICDRFKHDHGHGKEVIPESRIYLSPYFRSPLIYAKNIVTFQTTIRFFPHPKFQTPASPIPTPSTPISPLSCVSANISGCGKQNTHSRSFSSANGVPVNDPRRLC